MWFTESWFTERAFHCEKVVCAVKVVYRAREEEIQRGDGLQRGDFTKRR